MNQISSSKLSSQAIKDRILVCINALDKEHPKFKDIGRFLVSAGCYLQQRQKGSVADDTEKAFVEAFGAVQGIETNGKKKSVCEMLRGPSWESKYVDWLLQQLPKAPSGELPTPSKGDDNPQHKEPDLTMDENPEASDLCLTDQGHASSHELYLEPNSVTRESCKEEAGFSFNSNTPNEPPNAEMAEQIDAQTQVESGEELPTTPSTTSNTPETHGPVLIPVDLIDPHPAYPRIGAYTNRCQLEALMKRYGFEPCHAARVRPLGTRYQTMAGHQRIAMARSLGIRMVSAFVEQKSDLEAMAIMANDNSQAPLEKLEIGQLVLSMLALEPATSISAIAKSLGEDEENIRKYVNGAKVYLAISERLSGNVTGLRTKGAHLAIISRVQRDHWLALVEQGLALAGAWSVSATKKLVAPYLEAKTKKSNNHKVVENSSASDPLKPEAPVSNDSYKGLPFEGLGPPADAQTPDNCDLLRDLNSHGTATKIDGSCTTPLVECGEPSGTQQPEQMGSGPRPACVTSNTHTADRAKPNAVTFKDAWRLISRTISKKQHARKRKWVKMLANECGVETWIASDDPKVDLSNLTLALQSRFITLIESDCEQATLMHLQLVGMVAEIQKAINSASDETQDPP